MQKDKLALIYTVHCVTDGCMSVCLSVCEICTHLKCIYELGFVTIFCFLGADQLEQSMIEGIVLSSSCKIVNFLALAAMIDHPEHTENS